MDACIKPEPDDLNKTITNVEGPEDAKESSRCESPVFKSLNPSKITRAHSNSSDYDIPSYQINQSVKSRTSSKYSNETSDSILPFSPIFSPIPVASSVQFQPPSIHSLGTVAKNFEVSCKNKSGCNANKVSKKSCSVFEALGMNDKDISWVSSMASPPPPHIPGSQFNTVERATFFPEDKFQNIQPRALFSPTHDDDFGCQPITFSSDSEDEAYKSNVRLSDVCATLNKLEVKSLEQMFDLGDSNSLDKSISMENKSCPTSPVIKTQMKKWEGLKRKKKDLPALPSEEDKFEFSVGDSLTDNKSVRNSQSSNFIEDDSFQSMSFSGIDELCKTLVNVTEQSDTTTPSKLCSDCDKTVVNDSAICNSKPVEKKFYDSKTTTNVYKASSMDNLHSYAVALEEGDVCIPGSNNIDKWVTERGIVRFDVLEKDSGQRDGTKRPHSELSEKNEDFGEKKFKKVENDNSNWETMKKYLSESQLNISDGEIFRTVENLEKTLASQESKGSEKEKVDEALGGTESPVLENDLINPGNMKEESKDWRSDKGTDDNQSRINNYLEGSRGAKQFAVLPASAVFTTASGSKISVSEKALMKAREMLRECEEPQGSQKLKMEGFSTCSGKKISISNEALEKAKAFMSDCDQGFSGGFSTGSGKRIQVSSEALKKGKALMAECEEEATRASANGFSTCSGKKIQVSGKALEKAKTLMAECCEKEKPSAGKLAENWTKGFSTGSGKKIQVSPESLEKAKTLMSTCDEGLKETSAELASIWIEELADETSIKFSEKSDSAILSSEPALRKTDPSEGLFKDFTVGFSTASGNKVKVSAEALEKAKALLSEAEEIYEDVNRKVSFDEPPSFRGFSTAAGCKVTVSEEALAKAKERMEKWEVNQPDDSGNFDCADSFKTKEDSKSSDQGKPEGGLLPAARVEESGPGKSQEDDWDEIIPSWLHVYNTSPSIASDRIEISPVVSHEDGKSSRPEREYIVKSPVLGSSDRFYKKVKRRKLRFEEPKGPDKHRGEGFVVPYKEGGVKNSVKRNCNLSLDFSAPFKRTKLEDKGREETVGVDLREERRRAREDQERAIKEKQEVKPLRGSLLDRKRREKQVTWMKAVGGLCPEVHPEDYLRTMGVKEDVLSVTVENAASFKFTGEGFFKSNYLSNSKWIPAGDGWELIPDDDNRIGVEEFKNAFLASAGVQPNLVPAGWLENHFKWIVWKLSHYERSFPTFFGGRCLTPNNVALQLKYRYDREIDRNERSALRKILERDDTSVKRMVLCVCGIKKVVNSDITGYELNLTDGWYSCPAQTDPAMSRLIEEGKVSIGTKLVTQGATLVNCEQGVSPLELGGNVYLKISTNSTRRIRWDTKLGFHKNPENFPIALNSILPRGGQISRLDVILVRIYPMLYMEKTSDGHHVTRNRRSEEKAEAEYRRIQEERLESIRCEVQAEMRKSVAEKGFTGKRLNKKSLNEVERVEDLCQLMETSSDPSALQELMSTDQRRLLQNFQLRERDRFSRELTEKVESRLKKEKLNKRNVTEFFKAKVVDFRKPDYNNPAVLSVWNANEDLLGLLSEGKVISLMNVGIGSSKSRVQKPLQLNANRQTQYREMVKNVKYPARKLTRLKDVSSRICPAFEEVDLVGLVVLVRDVSYGSRMSQVVYLTDLEGNFAGIVFWGSHKDYGWENVLRVGSVVACSNLQWKKNSAPQEVPSLHVNECSAFTENPRHSHLKEEVERLRAAVPEDAKTLLSKCEEELTEKLEESRWRKNVPKDPSAAPRDGPRPANGFESGPTASSTPLKAFVGGVPSEEAEPSPIQKRIEKLQTYGEPPSLIPLLVRGTARRKFKKK